MKKQLNLLLTLVICVSLCMPFSQASAASLINLKRNTAAYTDFQEITIKSHSFASSYSVDTLYNRYSWTADNNYLYLVIKVDWRNISPYYMNSGDILGAKVIYNNKNYTTVVAPNHYDCGIPSLFKASNYILLSGEKLNLTYAVELPARAKTSGDLKIVFYNKNYDDVAEYIIRGAGADTSAQSIEVFGKNTISLRYSNGGYMLTIPAGDKFNILGYSEEYGLFEAEYQGTIGFVKGTGLNVPKSELLNSF